MSSKKFKKREIERNKENYKNARFKLIIIEISIIVFLLVLVYINF
jgi:hypothetical protein